MGTVRPFKIRNNAVGVRALIPRTVNPIADRDCVANQDPADEGDLIVRRVKSEAFAGFRNEQVLVLGWAVEKHCQANCVLTPK